MTNRERFEALSENEQYKLLVGCIAKEAKRRGVKVDALAHVGETYIKLMERLDGSEKDLPLVVMDAAGSAIAKAYREDAKYTAADNSPITGADGAELESILDVVAGPGSVEAEAIVRVDFSRFYAALDARNKKIVGGLVAGKVRRVIAPEIGISTTGVTKRVLKMRETLREYMD